MMAERKTARRLLLPLAVLIVGVVFSSCYQDYGLTVKDYDTYLTQYAQGTDFQNFKYFVLGPAVVHIGDSTGGSITHKYDDQILELTKANFLGRGFTQLPDTTSALAHKDSTLVVMVSMMSRSYVGYYYDYWWGYWGWYYPWYPGYYPPMYGGTYEYSTGTTITMAFDLGKSLANPPSTTPPNVGKRQAVAVWSAVITGLTGSPTTAPTRITDAINKTFEQSPYLYAGQ